MNQQEYVDDQDFTEDTTLGLVGGADLFIAHNLALGVQDRGRGVPPRRGAARQTCEVTGHPVPAPRLASPGLVLTTPQPDPIVLPDPSWRRLGRDGDMAPGAASESELEPTLETIGRLVDNIRIVRAIDVSQELGRLARIAESRRRTRPSS